ncbi:hypothetical protein AB0P28_15360 [Pseudarthrobacter sp. NPDC089323]|nr:hypothetical protein [Pseudarthrobacter sp. H3Y2-7]MDE8667707.1 hypothetical protein [Pseudarthrobacter sp. H3Y2-7]
MSAIGDEMPLLQSFLERQRERDAIFDYESGGVFVIFRRQYAEGDIAFYTGVHGGYIGAIKGLSSVPAHFAAAVALARMGRKDRCLVDARIAWPRLA